jgi:hypothetical protein
MAGVLAMFQNQYRCSIADHGGEDTEVPDVFQ